MGEKNDWPRVALIGSWQGLWMNHSCIWASALCHKMLTTWLASGHTFGGTGGRINQLLSFTLSPFIRLVVCHGYPSALFTGPDPSLTLSPFLDFTHTSPPRNIYLWP